MPENTKPTKKTAAANDRALLTVADTPLVETDHDTDDALPPFDATAAQPETSKVEDIKTTVTEALPTTSEVKATVTEALPKTSKGRKKAALGFGLGLTALVLLLRHHAHKNSSPSLVKKVTAGVLATKAAQAVAHRTH